jgi:hypothetical protein
MVAAAKRAAGERDCREKPPQLFFLFGLAEAA